MADLDQNLQPLAWLIGKYEDSFQNSLQIKGLEIRPGPDGDKLLVEYTTDWDYCEGKLYLRMDEVVKWDDASKAIEATYREGD